MRAFYRVPKSVFRDQGEDTVRPSDLGAVVLHTSQQDVFLHVADKTERLNALGALVAESWPALKAALTVSQRRGIFRKRVQRKVRDESGNLVTREVNVRMADVDPSDVAVQEWLPPHKWLGDPEPEPVP